LIYDDEFFLDHVVAILMHDVLHIIEEKHLQDSEKNILLIRLNMIDMD
jgi:hypothetical protein